jgi:sigma-B regulation protein RsbU (phosphoserine phosphatase)
MIEFGIHQNPPWEWRASRIAISAIPMVSVVEPVTSGWPLERDLEIAQRVQQSFLPRLPIHLNGLRLAALYRPAHYVGGDFYEVIPVGERRLYAAIGDVSGKGISAALLMSRVSSELRRVSKLALRPSEILSHLNEAFSQQLCEESFVTTACVLFDAANRWLTVSNAGHVPLLLRKPSGEVSTFANPSGPPLAMLESSQYVDEELALDSGDIVVMATDGVLDAFQHDEDALGFGCLRGLLSKLPPDIELINHRIAEVAKRRSEVRTETEEKVQIDDVTLLTCQLDG